MRIPIKRDSQLENGDYQAVLRHLEKVQNKDMEWLRWKFFVPEHQADVQGITTLSESTQDEAYQWARSLNPAIASMESWGSEDVLGRRCTLVVEVHEDLRGRKTILVNRIEPPEESGSPEKASAHGGDERDQKVSREEQRASRLDPTLGTGIPLASIFGYETGERGADPAQARKTAAALGVPVEHLVRDSRHAARPAAAKSASTSADRIRREWLRARLEYAFPQLFDREHLPHEQLEEAFEEAHVILGALGRTMSIEAHFFLEAMRSTLTAEALRQLCVAFYWEQLIREGEAASKQHPTVRE